MTVTRTEHKRRVVLARSKANRLHRLRTNITKLSVYNNHGLKTVESVRILLFRRLENTIIQYQVLYASVYGEADDTIESIINN